ncbi:Heat shock protein HtpX [hydrothermal vent metagenome]|uniref:Heat shock protein HtpX n=1 Tax=hydrothermal vent metagenome TaxID=652676 RepID=A0A1W1CPI1_9ZZZZ
MAEQFKTYFLMTLLTLFFIFVGSLIAGQTGMIIAFLVAIGMNFYAYYYSDEQVLNHYNAIPVDRRNVPELYDIVYDLTQEANLPMPQLYIVPDSIPNAFATGRDYEHSAVAVTEGILDLLTTEELAGVIAHELSHIKHYDMLIGTVAATFAGAISLLAQFGYIFGGDRENRNFIVDLVLMIVAPLAATVIQMSISRSREFEADRGAALMTGHPEWLQSALAKLDNYARQGVLHDAEPATAHMFIVNPFSAIRDSFSSLFSTHPSTQERIARLEGIKRELY